MTCILSEDVISSIGVNSITNVRGVRNRGSDWLDGESCLSVDHVVLPVGRVVLENHGS